MNNDSTDPLYPQEIIDACNFLKTNHSLLKNGNAIAFLECRYFESNKNRSAFIQLRYQRKSYESIVELYPLNIVHWQINANVQLAQSTEDYDAVEQIVQNDPDIQKILKERGLNPKKVKADSWCTGPWIDSNEGPERRLARPFLFYEYEKNSNYYAAPIDDIMILIDLDLEQVIKLQILKHFDDHASVPPKYDKLSEYENVVGDQKYHPQLKSLTIQQNDGPSFTVNGYNVKWMLWEFNVGFTPREGLVLHNVTIIDPDKNGQKRQVAKRMSVAEMIVPYASPRDPAWSKFAFDAGEDGLGRNANPLRLGCDCLGHIHYWPAHIATITGDSETIENAVCMHEEDFGLLYKHSDWRSGKVDSRRCRRLVVSFIATVANYDYGFYWYFMPEGTIELEVKLTGILSPSTVAMERGRYGVKVAPEVVAVTHQHFFTARLDMSVDGENNKVLELDLERVNNKKENPHGNAFYHTTKLLENETNRDVNPKKGRSWLVCSENTTNRNGHPCSYMLDPNTMTPAKPMAQKDSVLLSRASYLASSLWITRHSHREKFPTGRFPNQRNSDAGIPVWVKHRQGAESNIVNEDIVLWYTFGVNHVARTEDWPIMPVERALGFRIRPVHFFDRNPNMLLSKM